MRARPFSGVFDAQDPNSHIDSRERDEQLDVIRVDGTIVIRRKAAALEIVEIDLSVSAQRRK